MSDAPGIQRPSVDSNTSIGAAIRNIYDNLFYLRENSASKQSPGSHTIVLAKISANGTNGSITFTAEGVVSSYVDPT